MATYREILNKLKEGYGTSSFDQIILLEIEHSNQLRNKYNSLNSVMEFMQWLEEMSSMEESGNEFGIILRGIGGIGSF